jgi:hypothetical protein
VFDADAFTFIDERTFVFSSAMADASPFAVAYDNPMQSAVHYCQEFKSPEGLRAFPYCSNDPLSPVKRSILCTDNGGDQILAGRVYAETLQWDNLCYADNIITVTCFYIQGNTAFPTIVSIIDYYKNNVWTANAPYTLTIHIVPFSLKSLRYLIFNPIIYNVKNSVIIATNSEIVNHSTFTDAQNVSRLGTPPFEPDDTSLEYYQRLVVQYSYWPLDPQSPNEFKSIPGNSPSGYVNIPMLLIINECEMLIDVDGITITSIDRDIVQFIPSIGSPIVKVLSGNFKFTNNQVNLQDGHNPVPILFVGSDAQSSIISNNIMINVPAVAAAIGLDALSDPTIPYIPFVNINELQIVDNEVNNKPSSSISAVSIVAAFSRFKGSPTIYTTDSRRVPTPLAYFVNGVFAYRQHPLLYEGAPLTIVGASVRYRGIPIRVYFNNNDTSTPMWTTNPDNSLVPKWHVEALTPTTFILTPKGAPYVCFSITDRSFELCEHNSMSNDAMDPDSVFTFMLPAPNDCKNISGPMIYACTGPLATSSIASFTSPVCSNTSTGSIFIQDLSPDYMDLTESLPFIPNAYFSCVAGSKPTLVSSGYAALPYISEQFTIAVNYVLFYANDNDVVILGYGFQMINMSMYTGLPNFSTSYGDRPPNPTFGTVLLAICAILVGLLFIMNIVVVYIDNRRLYKEKEP